MTDATRELERKGRRVAGMFVTMIGAGVILESAALWTGVAVLFAGLGIYASGFVAKDTPGVLAEKVREES